MKLVRLLLSVLFLGVIPVDAFHSSTLHRTTVKNVGVKRKSNIATGSLLFRTTIGNKPQFHQSSSPRRDRLVLKLSEGNTSQRPPEKAPRPFFYGVMGAMYYIPIRYRSPQFKKLSAMSLAFYLFGRAVLLLDQKWLDKLVVPTIPPPLPAAETAQVMGIAEAVVAALLLFLPLENLHIAGKLAVLLLAASTPACIYHVVSKEVQAQTGTGVWMASVRLVFQGLFLHWANWFAMPW